MCNLEHRHTLEKALVVERWEVPVLARCHSPTLPEERTPGVPSRTTCRHRSCIRTRFHPDKDSNTRTRSDLPRTWCWRLSKLHRSLCFGRLRTIPIPPAKLVVVLEILRDFLNLVGNTKIHIDSNLLFILTFGPQVTNVLQLHRNSAFKQQYHCVTAAFSVTTNLIPAIIWFRRIDQRGLLARRPF